MTKTLLFTESILCPGIELYEADSLSYLTDVETEVQGRGGTGIKVTGLRRVDSRARAFAALSFGYCSGHMGFSPVGEKFQRG